MVKLRRAPARAPASREEAVQKRSEAGTSGSVPLVSGSASLVMPTDFPSAGGIIVASEPLRVVPADVGRAAADEEGEAAGAEGEAAEAEEGAAEAEEEEEDAEPPLKRKKVARLSDVPSRSAGRAVAEGQRKGKGRARAARPGQWESVLTLSENASFGDLGVTRYVADRVIPPLEERLMERKGSVELGSHLVRLLVRATATSSAVLQRVETLDQEVGGLHEQLKTVKDELAAAQEGSNLLQGKNESLEEEKRNYLKEKVVLEGRLEKAEEERAKERERRERENKEWKQTLRAERERIKQFHRTCESAVEGRDKAIEERDRAVEERDRVSDALREAQSSVKRQRIEAIKRWRERFLYEESMELACDITLSVLKRGYELYVPEGETFPSFREFAEPLLPEGLSLDEMTKKAEGEEMTIPDEELDRSPERVGVPLEDVPPVAPPDPAPVAPPGPAPVLIVSLDEEELSSGDVPLVASSGPAPLPSEASPERPPEPEHSPGYSPSPPRDA